MTRAEAIAEARDVARQNCIEMAVCWEGPHRDDFAPEDSHGFCPVEAVSVLYRYGTITDIVHPDGTVTEAQP